MKTPMKTAIKLALAGAVLASGAAQAQLITNTPTTASTGGSDLVLFVTDLTTDQYFIQDMGDPLNTIYTQAQVVADGVLTTQGHFTTPTNISGLDSSLASFLGGITNLSTDNIQYSFLAAGQFETRSNQYGAGVQRFLATSTLDLSGGTPYGSSTTLFSQSLVGQAGAGFASFVSWINDNCLTGNVCSSGWGDPSAEGVISDGTLAPQSWISATFGNGGPLGTAQRMYMFATNGSSGGAAANSNTYLGGMVNVSSAGDITVTNVAAVPLPAAAWLFGSGLLGLLGIGRRRALTA